ncbi:hypothetical protein [Thiocapsa imhoffii]|nr:hypothetical protein [Thiocapsa imhoffii]
MRKQHDAFVPAEIPFTGNMKDWATRVIYRGYGDQLTEIVVENVRKDLPKKMRPGYKPNLPLIRSQLYHSMQENGWSQKEVEMMGFTPKATPRVRGGR